MAKRVNTFPCAYCDTNSPQFSNGILDIDLTSLGLDLTQLDVFLHLCGLLSATVHLDLGINLNLLSGCGGGGLLGGIRGGCTTVSPPPRCPRRFRKECGRNIVAKVESLARSTIRKVLSGSCVDHNDCIRRCEAAAVTRSCGSSVHYECVAATVEYALSGALPTCTFFTGLPTDLVTAQACADVQVDTSGLTNSFCLLPL